MLVGNKKTQVNEQNWCIVLNPLTSEIDKKKVASKVSEVFHLSQDEANDLVSNTPIILLDNLTRTIAAQIKEYFRPTGAEMLLTNDTLFKRKCYRTVWPENPNLSFLNNAAPALRTSPEKLQEKALAPEEAMNEIRSLSSSRPAAPTPAFDKKSQAQFSQDRYNGNAQQELVRLKNEAELWRKKCEAGQADLERLQKKVQSYEQASNNQNLAAKEKEKDAQKFRTLLASSEEKYEGLKEEYRKARSLFEEKLDATNREITQLKSRLGELSQKGEQTSHLKQENEQLKKELEKRSAEETKRSDTAQQEYQKARALIESKITQAAQETQSWKLKAEELSRQIHAQEQEKSTLQQQLNEQMRLIEKKTAEVESLHRKTEMLVSSVQSDEGFRAKAEEIRKQLETEKSSLQQLLGQEREKNQRLNSENRELQDLHAQTEQKVQNLEQRLREHDMERGSLNEVLNAQLKEYQALKVELEEQRMRLEEEQSLRQELESREEEFRVQKQTLEQMFESEQKKLEMLQQDAARERAQNDQKLAASAQENEEWKIKADEMAAKIWTFEQGKKILEQNLSEKLRESEDLGKRVTDLSSQLKALNVRSEEEKARLEKHYGEKLSFADQEMESWKAKVEELNQKTHFLEQDKAIYQQKLTAQIRETESWETKHRDLVQKLDSVVKALEAEKSARMNIEDQRKTLETNMTGLQQKLMDQVRETQSWEAKSQELNQKFEGSRKEFESEKALREAGDRERKNLDNLRQDLERALIEERRKLDALQKQFAESKNQFEAQLSSSHLEIGEAKARIQDLTEKNQALEKTQMRLFKDLDDRQQVLSQTESRLRDVEKALGDIQKSHENLEKMLQVNLRHLENREKELENSRRQIRDLNQQLEQRDMIQKRTQLANALAEKENRLRLLVKEQERIESEIREREDSMRKVLSEQEKVEKDLIEGKQAQRHYLELAKKDKNPRVNNNRTVKPEDGILPPPGSVMTDETESLEND